MIMKWFFHKPSTYTMALIFILASLMTVPLHMTTVKANPVTINILPTSAPVGSQVMIAGVNATSGGEVRIFVLGFIFLATTRANATGGYSVNVSTPAVPSGTYPIMVLDLTTGDINSTMFTVEPRILLNHAEGAFNDRVTVKGDGFQSGSNITLAFDGIDITPAPQPMTDYMGSFEADFYVPSAPNRTYTVTATDLWANAASATFKVIPNLTMFPTSGAPSSIIIINGFGFAPSVNVTIHFDSIDVTPYPWVTTSSDGSFGCPFFVPEVSNGAHTINASDANGNWATARFVVGPPILMLTPDKTFESSIVMAEGIGFPQHTPIILKMEDMTMTNIIDLMWMSENLITDGYGSFKYNFVVPVTKSGVYTVVAYAASGPGPTELERIAAATLTIVDNSPLDVEVNVGSIHFKGEMAEFYVKTAFNGKLVNATIDKAMLYYSNGTLSTDLTANVKQMATGLYRIPYSIPGDATGGTYVVLVEASYGTDSIEAYGSSSASFLLSPTFTAENAQLISIEDDIGTIIIPDLGTIKANLIAINAKLSALNNSMATVQTDIGTIKTDTATIQLRVTAINGTVATIQTILGTIQGTVTLIEGNTATISTDLGTVKANVENVASEVTPAGFEIDVTTLILVLIAAIGSILSFIFIRKMKPATTSTIPAPETPTPPSPPAPPTP